MVLEGRVKTQRGGQNAILVDIGHILQLQHPSQSLSSALDACLLPGGLGGCDDGRK